MSLLRLEGVIAGYGGGDVLQGVDMALEPGAIGCIVGPNGAGKSTVLRAVSGLLHPRAGRIFLDDEEITGRHPSEILGLGIAQVPQSNGLFPNISVRENILMGGYILRRDKKLLAERYAAVEGMFSVVADRGGEKAGNLSGGQRRMVEIARSLMLDPRLVLLDEPSLGLAPLITQELFRRLGEINRETGLTLLVVEQNANLALDIGNRGYVLESGRIVTSGSAEDLKTDDAVRKAYLGF